MPHDAAAAIVIVNTDDPRKRFPRSARVRTRAEYSSVFNGARRVSDPLMTLHWLKADTPARLGLAVSRKVDVRAVEVHALAEPGQCDAVHGVAVVREALAGALPLPAAGGGAMDDDEGELLGGSGGMGRERAEERCGEEQDGEADRV